MSSIKSGKPGAARATARVAPAAPDLEARIAALEAELREARAQQAAAAEILEIINASPGDLGPVFQGILEKAHTLCGIESGGLVLFDGEQFRLVANHAMPERHAENVRRPYRAASGSAQERLLHGERFVHIEDVQANPTSPQNLSSIEAGTRTLLMVPLRKERALLGFITSIRREVRPFSEKEIALLESFAAQAVVAIENARLMTETREALEKQTATAEVLHVISGSAGGARPVFEAIVTRAARLCDADFSGVALFQDGLLHLAAVSDLPEAEGEALRSLFPRPPAHDFVMGRAFLDGATLHVDDILSYSGFSPQVRQGLQSVTGYRTTLGVPILHDGKPIGVIGCARREVRPFTPAQIELVRTFAEQAVIAIDNARLFGDLREALEQQTATAEVLGVINSSPGELGPVFDAILDKAHALCDAKIGWLSSFDGELVHTRAIRGFFDLDPSVVSEPFLPGPAMRRLIEGEGFVQIPDISETKGMQGTPPIWRASCELLGTGTYLVVPLRKDGTVHGFINAFRSPVRLFSDKEIALLQNFAAQAVVAMDNARLLDELRARTRDLEESLEFQTATSDVLQVISRSTFDLQPVLDTVCDTARRLCGAGVAAIATRQGEVYRYVAMSAVNPEWSAKVREIDYRPGRGSVAGRVLLEGQVVHIHDLAADPEYTVAGTVAVGNIRTILGVPLLREGEPVGVIALGHERVQPFTERQIELVRTFADQAAIAMENARLLGELHTRTRDLEQSLECQTATSELLELISRSTFDLQPVLNAVCETATRLCAASGAGLTIREGDDYRYVASHAIDSRFWELFRDRSFAADPNTMVGRVALAGEVVHVSDLAAEPDYRFPEAVTVGRIRALLGVPMLRDGQVVGTISVTRERVEPFTERQIELVRTFADQAVIAIENTRLLSELRESLEQQQAIAEVLQVINSSRGDLQPVFDILLDKAMRLCNAPAGYFLRYEGGRYEFAAGRGFSDAFVEYMTHMDQPQSGEANDRLRHGAPVVHILDLKDDEAYRSGVPLRRATVDLGGFRTGIGIPLRKGNELLGTFSLGRFEVHPFSDKEIALLQNFAAQAVVAIDNARLLNAIQQRQAELRVTFDNMGDGVAMFDAELKLAAWNRNFQQLLELPDEFIDGRPSFADYLRFLAGRGEYGTEDIEAELNRRLERTGEELRFERTRPDGRIIEVRRSVVPGGGFVLMYGDVTERKRAEAAIHAARDAAEKALAELRATQQQLVVQQKMAALGQLTAGIAHEIKNPLNFVNNFAGLSVELLDELKESAAPAFDTLEVGARAEIDETIEMLTGNLGKIAEHGRRADGIVKSMLAHSRGSSGERQAVDLNAVVEEALNLAYHGARAQDQTFNITMEREFAAAVAPIELVPQDVTRVFLNLIGNGFHAAHKRAREAAAPGFRPILKVTTRDLGDAVEVRVRDNGTGVLPEHRDKLFQPFFTTKPTGEGTGLGLSISYDIVTQQHGGTISVASEVGNFTEFTVRLPRRQPAGTSERTA